MITWNKLLNLFFDDDHAKEWMFCKHSTVPFMPSLLLNKSLNGYHIYTIFKNLVGINLVCHKSQRCFFFTSENHGNEKYGGSYHRFFRMIHLFWSPSMPSPNMHGPTILRAFQCRAPERSGATKKITRKSSSSEIGMEDPQNIYHETYNNIHLRKLWDR